MSPAELVLRILLALVLPPLGVIGLKDVGCGTFALMCVLTLFFWVPGQIAAIVLIVKEYSSSSVA
jgi:uncharacterized membrane protein YqaE (UPF0057 family)